MLVLRWAEQDSEAELTEPPNPLPLRPSSFVVTIAPGEDRVFALDVVRDADCFSPFLAEICALQRKLESVEIKARVVQPEMADEDRRYHFRMTGAYLASLQAAGDSYGDRTSETLRFVAERVEQGTGGEARVIAAPGSGDLLH